MQCPYCNNIIDDDSIFCISCGNKISNYNENYSSEQSILNPNTENPYTANTQQSPDQNYNRMQHINNVIDLTGQKQYQTVPQKKHTGTIVAAILTFLGWIVFFIVTMIIADSHSNQLLDTYLYYDGNIPLQNGQSYIPVLLATTLPIGIIGLIIVLLLKRRYHHLPLLLEKKVFVLYYVVASLAPSLINCFSYTGWDVNPAGDLTRVIVFFILLPVANFYLILTLVLAIQNNTKGILNILQAYFVGFLVSSVLSILFIKVFAAATIAIIILIVAVIVAFSNGGIFIHFKKGA